MMSYGSSQWRDWVLDEDDPRPIIQHAVEQGINFFDTANMYSRGISEEVTGRALRDFARREEMVITPIIGAGKKIYVDQAVAALDIDLSEDEVACLEEACEPHPVMGHM